LDLDPENGELISQIDLVYSAQKIVGLEFTTTEGFSLSYGQFPTTLSSAGTLFGTNETVVGFEGTASPSALFSITPLVVATDCWPRQLGRND
jgi:hypothetical protein